MATFTNPTGHYPPNPYIDVPVAAHGAVAERPTEVKTVKKTWTAVQAATSAVAAVHAAVTDNGSDQVITTGFTALPCPRNVTATAGGTAGDIKAVQVIVAGLRNGVAISETLPAFTVNSAGSVAGSKIFDSVTSMTIPAHDGTGATTSLGTGEKLGLPHQLARNTVIATYLDNVIEGTPATVAFDSDELEKNYIDLNSALNSTQVDCYYRVP